MEVDMTSSVEFVGGPEYSSLCSYDLVSAVQRQSAFYYNVSLPHYRNDNFLRGGIHRYKVRAAKHTATLLGCFFNTHHSFHKYCRFADNFSDISLISIMFASCFHSNKMEGCEILAPKGYLKSRSQVLAVCR